MSFARNCGSVMTSCGPRTAPKVMWRAGAGAANAVRTAKRLKPLYEATCRTHNEMRKRGIRIVVGGDYGFAATPQGTNARDLEYFVTHFGFSPSAALDLRAEYAGLSAELAAQSSQMAAVPTTVVVPVIDPYGLYGYPYDSYGYPYTLYSSPVMTYPGYSGVFGSGFTGSLTGYTGSPTGFTGYPTGFTGSPYFDF